MGSELIIDEADEKRERMTGRTKDKRDEAKEKVIGEAITVDKQNTSKKKRGCLFYLAIAAGIYILLTLWMQWTPPVKGIVVDAETGEPIAGVEIIRQGQGDAISGVGIVSTAGCKKTDENGRFSIWGTFESTMSTWWSYFVPIWSIDKVDLHVYHPDYVTTFTEVEIGKVGVTDRVVTRRESFEERRFLYESMRFKIKLAKPKTERDWSEKCDQSIRAYMNFQDRHGVDEWLFNDLVGYLERYPNGEKAGEYMNEAYHVTLVRYEGKEKPTDEDKQRFSNGARLLLNLAEKVQSPQEPWGLKAEYEMRLNELKKEFSELETLSKEGVEK